MPKLCLSRLSVDEPFSCPITQMLSPLKRPKPLRMAGDLRLLPRRQLGIEVAQRLRGLGFKPADIVGYIGCVARGLHRAQFLDLGLKLGHRLFKVEIGAHLRKNAVPVLYNRSARNWPVTEL